jgi:hypothetical protein
MRRLSRMSRPVKILVAGRKAGRLLGPRRGSARRRGDRFGIEHGPVDEAGRQPEPSVVMPPIVDSDDSSQTRSPTRA